VANAQSEHRGLPATILPAIGWRKVGHIVTSLSNTNLSNSGVISDPFIRQSQKAISVILDSLDRNWVVEWDDGFGPTFTRCGNPNAFNDHVCYYPSAKLIRVIYQQNTFIAGGIEEGKLNLYTV
jgi:hypothetical protein